MDVEKSTVPTELDAREAPEEVRLTTKCLAPTPYPIMLTTMQQLGATSDPTGVDLEKHLTRKSTKGPQRLEQEVFLVTDLDNSLVGWDSQTDPSNPRNFPQRKKWLILGMISAITFLCPLVSSIFAPGTSFMMREFGETSHLLAAFTISVFVLGFAVSAHEFIRANH
jgi:hypothetical protein